MTAAAAPAWTDVSIPADPTPKLVHVTNISATATTEKVREFFLFCGKIAAFQLLPSPASKTTPPAQEALILFEKESAARTATMLSNAVIADSQITVTYHFSQYSPSDASHNAAAAADATTASENSQEAKPKTGIMTEMIASGITISTPILHRAKDFDAKYGVSSRMQTYYAQALEKIHAVDDKYALSRTATEKLGALDEKYGVKGKVLDVVDKVGKSAPGVMVQGVYNQAVETVVAGKHLAEEKEKEKSKKEGGSASSSSDEEDVAKPVAPAAVTAAAPAVEKK